MLKPSKYGFHKLTSVGDSVTLETTGPARTKRLTTAARDYAEIRDWGVSIKKQSEGVIAVIRVR